MVQLETKIILPCGCHHAYRITDRHPNKDFILEHALLMAHKIAEKYSTHTCEDKTP